MGRFKLLIATAALVATAAGHAILTEPTPRNHQGVQGVKLTPFASAYPMSSNTCGGEANVAPGSPLGANTVQIPQVAYTPGQIIEVKWRLTIPHPVDVSDQGVRIALHYGPGDTFLSNVLKGGISPDIQAGTLPVSSEDALANSEQGTIITLPVGKTCNYCVLQWTWTARADGGFYMGCADIAITTNGLLPDYATLNPETNNEVPQNNPVIGNPVGSDPSAPVGGVANQNVEDSGGGSGMVILLVIALLVIAAVGGGYYYFYVIPQRAEKSGMAIVGASQQQDGLPPGWVSAVDPASGRTYYTNSMTNETTWEMPVGGMQPAPPAPPAPPGGLPAGWVESTDPATGRMYFINNATGQSSWERPTNRF